MKRSTIQLMAAVLAGIPVITNASALVYSNPDLGERYAETVTINLAGLAPHNEVVVHFDLYMFDSWDGNTTVGGTVPEDHFGIEFDGALLSWTFDNFDHSDETNVDVADETGDLNSQNNWQGIDRLFRDYSGGFTYTHTNDSLTLRFLGFGSGFQNDESWKVANLTITTNAVPIPVSSVLLGSGLIGIAGAGRLTRRNRPQAS